MDSSNLIMHTENIYAWLSTTNVVPKVGLLAAFKPELRSPRSLLLLHRVRLLCTDLPIATAAALTTPSHCITCRLVFKSLRTYSNFIKINAESLHENLAPIALKLKKNNQSLKTFTWNHKEHHTSSNHTIDSLQQDLEKKSSHLIQSHCMNT
jgi:hypothetical protein